MPKITGPNGLSPVVSSDTNDGDISANRSRQGEVNSPTVDVFDLHSSDRGQNFLITVPDIRWREPAVDQTPALFLKVLQFWPRKDSSFSDGGVELWNNEYYLTSLRESHTPPQGFDPRTIPGVGNVKYYVVNLKSSAFRDENHALQFWIQRNDADEIIRSDWIGNAQNTPDFYWPSHVTSSRSS